MKETSDDYRYFPDPDLPKLKISEIPEFSTEKIEDSLPELPQKTRERLREQGLASDDVDTLLQRPDLRELFDATIAEIGGDEEVARLAVNYITSDVIGLEREHEKQQEIDPVNFAALIEMLLADDLSSRGGKDVLKILFTDGGDPQKIAEEESLLQKSSKDDLQPVVEEIIAENPEVVADYQDGNESAVQFLIGQGMKKTQGAANPNVLKEMLEAACEK